MRIRLDYRGATSDLDVRGLPSDTTVGELVDVLAADGGSAVIDGVEAAFDRRAADVVRDGSTVRVDAPRPASHETVVALLHAVAGPAAGKVWRLQAGTYAVGPGCTIALTGVRGTLTVSRGGTVRWDGRTMPPGILAAGEHRLRAGRPVADGTNHPRGDRSFFNRPPRQLDPHPPSAIDVPARVKVTGKPRRLSPLMIVLPAITGVGMAVIFGRLMFLAFALLGPITMIGSAVDDRRRRAREQRESDDQFASDLERFEDELERAGRAHRRQLTEANPSVSELLMVANARSQRIWERRPGHPDHMTAAIGYGRITWTPPLSGDASADTAVSAARAAGSRLDDAPITTRLAERRVLGIADDRVAGRAVAADIICQLATTHGPSDLRLAVVTDDHTIWDWTKWLPHTMSNQLSGLRLLGSSDDEINAILGALRTGQPADDDPIVLLVIDHDALDEDQQRVIRECLSGLGRRCAAIAIVDRVEHLPAQSTEVIELGPSPAFRRPHAGMTIGDILPRQTTSDVAGELARALAPLDDPEAAVAGAGLPDRVDLLDLLDMAEPTGTTIAGRWQAAGRAPRLATPVGTSETGTYVVDLISDGPHGLMAGTTGSGKSEFLRTLVAGLAATVSPEYLTFVLVDYKGGAAFDVCADLPHVVGLVTDLDEHLGRRALQSLEAELHHREERLRDAGASDIDELWRQRGRAPLPRLAVVVDEFATLAKELPDFMDALVDIAQRGRSLGVHMILATQRPSGVIKDSIRANTNLRISLRVQTVSDSKDVLNAPDAAAIPRSRPGRGYARLGPGELVPFQTAIVTTSSAGTSDDVTATPFVFGMVQPEAPKPVRRGATTDLERLVAAIAEAHEGSEPPRRPWQPDLRTDLGWTDLPCGDEPLTATIGIVDQPRRQAQSPWRWKPHDDGNLLMVGTAGWGPTDGLLAAAIGLTQTAEPDELHLYAIDHGSGRLAALEALPHVATVVGSSDIERQRRTLRRIKDELDVRKMGGRGPTIVLLIDGIAGFRSTFDEPDLVAYRDMLGEIATSGPPQGVFVAVAADQNRSVPSALAGALPRRLVFSLADRLEYGMLGIRAVGDLPRRRGIDPETQEHVQVALVGTDDITHAAADISLTTRTPAPVEVLPTFVRVGDVVDAGTSRDDGITLPVGVEDDSLLAATIDLYDGEHFLIGGPPRSGRSTVLTALAEIVRKIAPDDRLLAVCPRPSALRLTPHVDSVGRFLVDVGPLDQADRRTWVFIDDADEVEDDGTLSGLIEQRAEHLLVVAAGRTDSLRGHHRHWTKPIRSGRRGLILRPMDPGDGDLLGARLPRGRPVTQAGRGYLVDAGVARLIQSVSV